MVTVFPPVVEVVGAAVAGGACDEEHPAAILETIKRTTHAMLKIKRDFGCITPYWIVMLKNVILFLY
jgi:hypothetical protein